MVKKIGSAAEFEAALQAASSKLVVIDFFATWCGPCKMIAPKLEAMAVEFGEKLVILKVDVDECEDLAAQYNIEAMPTFIFLKNREKVDDLKGANEAALRTKIQNHI